MMTIVFYIILGYLCFTTAILLINKRDFDTLPPVPSYYFSQQAPSVSICIPARNEEATIERCIRSALYQQYPNFNVAVLNDQSTDRTPAILNRLKDEFSNKLTIIDGRPKPEGWVGKPWACHQLAEATGGEILIFIDSDTWLEPSAIARTVRTMGQNVLDFLTLWPVQILQSFWEKNIIPLIYFTLFTLLPVRYIKHSPKWLPSFLRKKMNPFFAAACGQFMAFKRSSYNAIGGHQSVYDEIVEDVALAKQIKRAGYSMNMYYGDDVVSCRMYRSSKELWKGLSKNFLAGFNYNIPLFVSMSILHLAVHLLPFLVLPFLLWFGNPTLSILCGGCCLFIIYQRLIINRWFNWSYWYAFCHPIGVGWFQLLGFYALKGYYNNEAPEWKGRKLE